ncbi:hypothetical protein [Kordiimonas sp.]|uniref:hypothetical protein n=1 Tax=Kordiimonas sp. TaxID=1970157 RepID=UPI003B515586
MAKELSYWYLNRLLDVLPQRQHKRNGKPGTYSSLSSFYSCNGGKNSEGKKEKNIPEGKSRKKC